MIMFLAERLHRAAVSAALAGSIVAGLRPFCLRAQDRLQATEPTSIALPLPEDRGGAELEQALRRLGTTASVMMIVAHPDDEDGGLLTYLSRGEGARATLFTLTRGEGGQNAMSADTYDALGIIRTNELLKADQYYGANQLWGTEADFGFSKTQEEAFARWGHDRVLYDAVLAVRQQRPQIIVSTFIGAITDGHGQHQVSGEIAQEAFKAAADPSVFPEQLKNGLQPWQPLAVYSMTPFAPVTEKGMFDYATGKWAPAKFHDYVTNDWITGKVPSTDVTLPIGKLDPTLGRSYAQIAREGWGEQKSQYGGANPPLSGPAEANYHLWAVAPRAKAEATRGAADGDDLFHNSKVSIDTTLEGLAHFVPGTAPSWLTAGLEQIATGLKEFESKCPCHQTPSLAHALAPIYRQTLDLRTRVATSDLDAEPKADLLFELDAKIEQFQAAMKELLGLDVIAFRTNETNPGGFRYSSADETARSVSPGEEFKVRVHTTRAASGAKLERVWLESCSGTTWKSELTAGKTTDSGPVADPVFRVRVAEDAESTKPFFTRPTIEQPYYDISNPAWRLRSFAPWPLAAWVEYSFDGVPIPIGQVVQTLQRVTGPGGIYQPLVVTPAIGVRIDPQARILPLNGAALPVHVTVHTQSAADGSVVLKLPDGWHAEPSEAKFHRTEAGDTESIQFSVTPSQAKTAAYSIQAIAHSAGRTYESGWQSVGYAGLRPYNQYTPAQLRTRKIDVKLAPGLRIGYVMGPGDLVADAIEGLGVSPHMISADELASGDLSAWNVIVIGIRAYAVRPELAAAQPRLDDFVRRGGTLIVQYQSSTFPAPLPVNMGRIPERVVEEQAPVKLLDPKNRLFSWPNTIASADFDGWVEERGHGFLDSWNEGYTALTETADAGQDPQRGGLLIAHPGKGTYIYVAYALYRQLPELVPGSYRILANLLSAGKDE
jgi:LmbE family N-acetylglucosaminyl deacetylase